METESPSRRRQPGLIARGSLAALALIGAAMAGASDDGFYGGRSLIVGTPSLAAENKVERAYEPGSVMLVEDGARLDSERTIAGYRFGPGFALEGAQTRFGAAALRSGGETLSLAGVSSIPVTESITLSAKFGLHYPQSYITSGEFSDTGFAGKLYGMGLSYQVAENVELRAQSERYLHSPTGQSGAGTVDTVLLGANVRF